MREQNEALAQLEEISRAIAASNQYLLSRALLTTYGIVILSLPIVETMTQYLTFGNYTRQEKPIAFALSHIAVYLFLIFATKRIVARLFSEEHVVAPHPILRRSLSLYKPVLASTALTCLCFLPMNYEYLIYPMVFVYLGIMFNFFGRLTSHFMYLISWSYIIVGFIFVIVSPHSEPYLWMVFNTYLGITLVCLGLKQKNLKS